jgi:hypothetical protein
LAIVSVVAPFLSEETRFTNLDTMAIEATAAEIDTTLLCVCQP